jgi:hypothetical protein
MIRKPLKVFGVSCLLLELVYVLAAHIFLHSSLFSKIVNEDPVEAFVHFDSAWTIFPGLAHVRGLLVKGQDGSIGWQVEVKKATVLVNLPALLVRKFQTLKVEADGGLFQLSLGQPLKKTQSSHSANPFKIEIGGLHIQNFQTMAFGDYRYQGSAELGGSFLLWPGRELEISKALIQVHGGSVLLGEKSLSNDLNGEIRGSLKNWFMTRETNADIFDKITAELNIQSQIDKVDFLNTFLTSLPWLKIKGVSGTIKSDVHIKEGILQSPSAVEVDAKGVETGLGPYFARGRGAFRWGFDSDGILLKGRVFDYQGLNANQSLVILEGKSLELEAKNFELRLRDFFSPNAKLRASLKLSSAVVKDITFLNDFVPVRENLNFLAGAAGLDAKLFVSTFQSSPPGEVRFWAKGAKLRFKTVKLSGDFDLVALVKDQGKAEVFDFSASKLNLHHVRVDGASLPNAKDWSGEIVAKKAILNLKDKPLFVGRGAVSLDDARPILSVLATDSKIASMLSKAVQLEKIEGESEFHLEPGLMEFSRLKIDSSTLKLEGALRFLKRNEKILALVDVGKLLQVGIFINGKHNENKILHARKWYEEQLKGF